MLTGRAVVLAGIVVLTACGSAGPAAKRPGGSLPPSTTTSVPSASPGVRVAVAGPSGLDIVGPGGTIRVAGPGAAAPAWSPDGSTLAYLDHQPGRLWLADTSGHTRLVADRALESFAWSPAGGRLAAVPIQGAGPGGLITLDTGGQVTTLVGSDFLVGSYAWSPDGGSIAYAQAFPAMSAGPAGRTDRLYVRDLGAPGPTGVAYDPGLYGGILLAGWWPNGKGLYLWPDPQHSSSIAADGLPLQAVSLPDGRVSSVGTTLPLAQALAFSPDGGRVAVMRGGFRLINQDKDLAVCPVGTGTCSAIPQPSGTVSVQPAWSPDGREVVFVRGPDDPEATADAWTAATRLYLYDVASGAVRPVPGAPAGVGNPRFTADGRGLVFQRSTDLVELGLATGATRRLAGGVAPLVIQPGVLDYAWSGVAR